MFTRVSRMAPESFRSVVVAAGIVVIATLSTAGAGMASTDPNAGIPDRSIESLCPQMEVLFRAEGRWLVENQPLYEPDDPVMVSHRIQYWNYWHFLETYCGGAPIAHRLAG